MPDLFDSSEDFLRWFAAPLEVEGRGLGSLPHPSGQGLSFTLRSAPLVASGASRGGRSGRRGERDAEPGGVHACDPPAARCAAPLHAEAAQGVGGCGAPAQDGAHPPLRHVAVSGEGINIGFLPVRQTALAITPFSNYQGSNCLPFRPRWPLSPPAASAVRLAATTMASLSSRSTTWPWSCATSATTLSSAAFTPRTRSWACLHKARSRPALLSVAKWTCWTSCSRGCMRGATR